MINPGGHSIRTSQLGTRQLEIHKIGNPQISINPMGNSQINIIQLAELTQSKEIACSFTHRRMSEKPKLLLCPLQCST
jgi:hypothetical protein